MKQKIKCTKGKCVETGTIASELEFISGDDESSQIELSMLKKLI